MSWDSAIAYCKKLSLAGYNGWRLPNIEQLKSIIDVGKKPTAEGEAQNTLIDKTYFPNAAPYGGGYWSSITMVNEPYAAWWLSFADGNDYGDRKGGNLNVRCVRS